MTIPLHNADLNQGNSCILNFKAPMYSAKTSGLRILLMVNTDSPDCPEYAWSE